MLLIHKHNILTWLITLAIMLIIYVPVYVTKINDYKKDIYICEDNEIKIAGNFTLINKNNIYYFQIRNDLCKSKEQREVYKSIKNNTIVPAFRSENYKKCDLYSENRKCDESYEKFISGISVFAIPISLFIIFSVVRDYIKNKYKPVDTINIDICNKCGWDNYLVSANKICYDCINKEQKETLITGREMQYSAFSSINIDEDYGDDSL